MGDEKRDAEELTAWQLRLARDVLERLNEHNAQNAIRDILRLIKMATGFEAVAIRLREGEDFPCYETSGFPDRFVCDERYLCDREASGRVIRDAHGNPVLECMCGNILRGRIDPSKPFFTSGGSFWTNSTTELLASTTPEDRQSRTRNRCHGEGYESVALVPLKSGGAIIGLLQLNDRRRDLFTPEMISYFEGLGASIGIALARQRQEEALRKSEERHRALYESSRDAIMTLEPPDWRFTAGNPATIAMFLARDEAEFTSKDPWELSPEHQPDGRPSSEKAAGMIGKAMAEGSHFFDWTHRRLDGTDFPATVLLTRIELGGRRFLQATVRDVTGRRRTEEALRESEEKYRSLVETTDTGFLILDAQGRVLDANQEYVRLTGHGTLDEIRGRSVVEWIAAHARQENAEAVARCARDGLIRNFVTEYVDGSGRTTPIEINATVHGQGPGARIISLCRDITERTRAAEALREAEKFKAVGQLAGGIAHEFNNKMSVVLAYSDFVLEGLPPGSPLRADVQEIIKAGQRVAELTRQILAVGQKQMLKDEAVRLNDVVIGVGRTVALLVGPDVELSVALDPHLADVMADERQIEEAVICLVQNANDAMPHGGRLAIRTENAIVDEAYGRMVPGAKPGRYATLIVQDTGRGMTRDVMDHLFEPFFTTKGLAKGTGLALSAVNGMVKQSGGWISVSTEPGKGSTFRVFLPAMAS